uniref:Uncharacterized protein n=1 Tax=Micrurus corallinus TaxID=54390 RepID=A0A2D4F3X5_MICCO
MAASFTANEIFLNSHIVGSIMVNFHDDRNIHHINICTTVLWNRANPLPPISQLEKKCLLFLVILPFTWSKMMGTLTIQKLSSVTYGAMLRFKRLPWRVMKVLVVSIKWEIQIICNQCLLFSKLSKAREQRGKKW